MSRPVTNSKVLLVVDRRVTASGSGAGPLRRYRLARLRFDGSSGASDIRACSASGPSDEARRLAG